MGFVALSIAGLTSTWPYFISHLFPTRIRYTCVGLSFNISDGVIGGLSSLVSLYLIYVKKDFNTFLWIIFVSCITSIVSCLKIKLIKEKYLK